MKVYAIECIELHEGRNTIAIFSDSGKVIRYFNLHNLNTWTPEATVWYSIIEFELDPK